MGEKPLDIDELPTRASAPAATEALGVDAPPPGAVGTSSVGAAVGRNIPQGTVDTNRENGAPGSDGDPGSDPAGGAGGTGPSGGIGTAANAGQVAQAGAGGTGDAADGGTAAKPGAPGNLQAKKGPLSKTGSSTTATLTWSAPTGSIKEYRVHRNKGVLATTFGTSYTDNNVPASGATYSVTATNSAGEGPASNAVTVT